MTELSFTIQQMMDITEKAKDNGRMEAYLFSANCIDNATDPGEVSDLLRVTARRILEGRE